MKIAERDKAVLLRKKGMTINEIVQKTGFSKASVSVWVRNVELTEAQKVRISQKGRSLRSIELRRASRLSNEKTKKDLIRREAKKEIEGFSKRDLFIVGTMLYLGEGNKKSKGRAAVTNADPAVIRMMVRFFKESCGVSSEKLRGHIHIHSHLSIKKAESYWSDISGVPKNQFYKTYSKKSIASLDKRDTLPYGTFEISVNDTRLFIKILSWIEKIQELVLVDQK